MKKIIALILVLLTFTSATFAYTASENDIKILNNFYTKLDKIGVKNPEKAKKLGTQIDSLKEKYKNNEKIYFLLSEIVKYINNKYDVYKVLKVIDGDTLQINYNGKEESFRLIGVDSPESYTTRYGYKECFGDEASKYLKNILDGKSVKIEFDETQGKTDKYGRYLAYIFLDGKNINDEMIKNGYAWEYTYNKPYKYQETFKNSQKVAKESNAGLWNNSTCNGERKKLEEANITGTGIINNTGSLNLDSIINQSGVINTDTSKNINIGSFSCSIKKTYCTEMTTCEEAKFYLNSCGLSRLDADKDGIPCESLCK